MANGMGSLYIGNSGLRASQDAINTVANNLANVGTKGYVRQQVVFRDTSYVSFGYSKNGNNKQTGLGTSIGEIVHARDIFLDKAFRTDNGRRAYYETSFETVDEVQTLFQELEGTAFQQILTDHEASLWQSFQELAKNPSDTVNQNLVIQRSGLFVSRAQAIYSSLLDYQKNVNVKISENVDLINDYFKDIFELNKQVMAIEAGGREVAMNERDARDYIIDQLSALGKIEYTEGLNGTVSLKFEGQLAVDDMFCYQIGKKYDVTNGFITPYWKHLSNESAGKYAPVVDFSREISSAYNNDVGELKALLQVRGDGYANYNNIENINADVYDKTIGMSVIQNTQAEFDQLVHGIVTQINDALAPNKKMDVLTVKNDDGTYSEYRNVYVLDEENCCVGADGKKPPQELFTRTGCERYQKAKGVDGKTYYIYNVEDSNDSVEYYMNGKTYRIYDTNNNTTVSTFNKLDAAGKPMDYTSFDVPYTPWNKEGNEKYYYKMVNGMPLYVLNENYEYDTSKQYTMQEIKVNHNLKEQVTNLPYINSRDEVDYALANRLASLWDNKSLTISPHYTTGFTFSEYYQEMIGEIGIVGYMYESTAENLTSAVEAIDNQRQGVIGVSSEEELSNMIKYQNAYNASSRYIQTVSDMIEILVSGL